MATKETIEAAMSEMDYSVVDNGVLELPASKPAAFSFEGDPSLDVDALEEELESNDFGMLTPNHETREDGKFYCFVDVVTDHYKKVKVKIWNDTVCIFPDEELPDTYEFTRTVQAIETALGADVEHDPVDREADDAER